jgi:hypothetical protein
MELPSWERRVAVGPSFASSGLPKALDLRVSAPPHPLADPLSCTRCLH